MNNRQNGRRRGRGGQQARNGQPGAQDRGNRIDNRARGNAAQLLEKYKSLARDAQMQGDRVNTEYYLQFADHYFRVLSENRLRFEEQRPRRDEQQDYGHEGDYDADPQPGFGQREQAGEAGWGDRDDRRPAEPARAEAAQPGFDAQEAEAGEFGFETAPDRSGARSRRGRRPANGYAGGGESGGNGGEAEGSGRIEMERLPQAFTPPVAANEEAAGGDEATRPRRRAPRRPRGESSLAEA